MTETVWTRHIPAAISCTRARLVGALPGSEMCATYGPSHITNALSRRTSVESGQPGYTCALSPESHACSMRALSASQRSNWTTTSGSHDVVFAGV